MERRKINQKNQIQIPPYNLENDGVYFNNTLKFNAKQGHGFAAEQANNFLDNLKGDKALVLNENFKNGPDRIVNGISIQTKYCKTPQATFMNCFSEGKFRYEGQQIEVPPEQYDEVVRLFQKKGLKDVQVRKGLVSYKVAKNIAKYGTVEGLTYDAATGIHMAKNSFGISFVFTFLMAKMNGATIEDCLIESFQSASKVFGMNFVSHIFSQQFARSSLNGVAHRSTLNLLKKVLNKDQFASFANSLRGEGAKKIYGAAAQQNTAKIVKGQAVFTVGILALQTIWDVYQVTEGKISNKQLAKNFFSNLGSASGGIAGAVYGTCIAGPIGGIIGGIIGGLVSQFIVKSIADQITLDDLEEMAQILQEVVIDLQKQEYWLQEKEYKQVLDQIYSILQQNNDFLQNMFQSNNKRMFARREIKPLFQKALKKREKIFLFSDLN